MFANLYARAVTILATDGEIGVGGRTKTDILDDATFTVPRLILQVMSIGFLFYAIFKIVGAIAKAAFPTAIGFVVSAAFVLFLAWNPSALLTLLETVGGAFQNLFDLISN